MQDGVVSSEEAGWLHVLLPSASLTEASQRAGSVPAPPGAARWSRDVPAVHAGTSLTPVSVFAGS